MAGKKTSPRKRSGRRKASEMMGRESGKIEPSATIFDEPETTDTPRPAWFFPALGGLAIAAIGSAVAAGMTRGPKEGAAVFVGVLVIGLLFGALLRPPPLRDRPGDGAAIDFGRIDDASGGGGGTQDRSPSRAERRREAKGQRRS